MHGAYAARETGGSMSSRVRSLSLILVAIVAAACGPTTRNGDNGGGDGGTNPSCTDGQTEACYDGAQGTQGVGPCVGGMHTCIGSTWGPCNGEVVPVAEICGDNIDQNCSGVADEAIDADGDGYVTCPTDGSKADCCDSTECADPAHVNPGAYDVPGDHVDNDCDGIVDNGDALCDTGLASNSSTAMDYAKAIDICRTATVAGKDWGVIEAKLTLADGTGTPADVSHSIRPHFGTGTTPKLGSSLIELSTGHAAATGETNPAFLDFGVRGTAIGSTGNNKTSPFPQPFYMKNGNKLPSAPGCTQSALGTPQAYDPVMLTLKIRVPTNANSFTLDTSFFSSEFPEYVCSDFNDFFVVLLDSTYTGTPANPTDGNLAFYKNTTNGQVYPVGVNLAHADAGLFQQCKNGATGCDTLGGASAITTCTGVDNLAGTGMDRTEANSCDADSIEGGGTGWLETSGNVKPGEIITVRIAVWDAGDHVLDSLAVVDAFRWNAVPADPGTVIF